MNIGGKRITIIAGLVVAIGLIGGAAYYSRSSAAASGPIVDFDEERDTQAMLKIFYDDYYWLFPGPDYSPEYILKYRSPGQSPMYARYLGKLHIKVLRENNTVAGFTTYYQENFYNGEIQFIAVSKDFRRKGYGKMLTEYAVKELFKMGCKKVSLLTRVSNVARKLYEKIGFKETSHDEEFVFYSIYPSDFKG
jgi:ribosomal protein S18 acetylase RimI-like enzyme